MRSCHFTFERCGNAWDKVGKEIDVLTSHSLSGHVCRAASVNHKLQGRLFKRSLTQTMDQKIFGPPDHFCQWVVLRRQMLFQSTPYAFMKLFKINGVYIKAFGKLKMAQNLVLLTLVKPCLNNWPIAFSHYITAAILASQNNKTAVLWVNQANPVGVRLFPYVNTFIYFSKLACVLTT